MFGKGDPICGLHLKKCAFTCIFFRDFAKNALTLESGTLRCADSGQILRSQNGDDNQLRHLPDTPKAPSSSSTGPSSYSYEENGPSEISRPSTDGVSTGVRGRVQLLIILGAAAAVLARNVNPV